MANESCAHPELVSALRVIVDRIDASIPRTYAEPVAIFITGGVAMNYYCGSRYTEDVDASFSKRLLLNFDELRADQCPAAAKACLGGVT